MERSARSRAFLAIVLLGAGILVVGQLRVQRRLRVVSEDQDEQALLLSELVGANKRLRDEIGLLNAQLAAYDHESRRPILEELVVELSRVRVLNGQVEVSGPGIELLIDGPLSALDLHDLINELRNAGAEAIALNDQRLVSSSALVVQEGELVTSYGQPIGRPYHLLAIGDPDTIESALLRPGGLVSLLRGAYPSLSVQFERHSRVSLGVDRSQRALVYAQPVE